MNYFSLFSYNRNLEKKSDEKGEKNSDEKGEKNSDEKLHLHTYFKVALNTILGCNIVSKAIPYVNVSNNFTFIP